MHSDNQVASLKPILTNTISSARSVLNEQQKDLQIPLGLTASYMRTENDQTYFMLHHLNCHSPHT